VCGYKPNKSVARCSPDCRTEHDGASIWPLTLGPLTVIATVDSQTKRFELMVVEPTFEVCVLAVDQS